MQTDDLLRRLNYVRPTGKFYWVDAPEPNAKRLNGKEAGTLDKNGYLVIMYKKKGFKAHRLIWIIETGKANFGIIDHINGNKIDNRVENLREVSHTLNTRNTHRHRKGKLLGCGFHKASQTWRAFARLNGKQVSIGYGFKNEKEAHLAYVNYTERMSG